MVKCKYCGQEKSQKKVPKNLTKFLETIERQFEKGVNIDILFKDFGKEWILGAIANYAKEGKVILVGYYQFILWLKRGFHLKMKGSYEVIDTTVNVKKKYFPYFIDRVIAYIENNNNIEEKCPIDTIYKLLKDCSNSIFCLTEEKIYLQIFSLSYYIWNKEIKMKGTDEDVFNESKNKGGR